MIVYIFHLTSQTVPKNVDAGAAKELMANLVKLQSSLPEVNKYVIGILALLILL